MFMSAREKIISSNLITELIKTFPPEIVQFNVPLCKFSRWNVGGNADLILKPKNIDQLCKLRFWLNQRDLPSVIIGSTSNLLFSDQGLRTVGIYTGNLETDYIKIEKDIVVVGAGVWVPHLARMAMMKNLSGLEHTCGIPGTLGGLVYMNGGSQRKGIGENVISVISVNGGGEVVKRSRSECEFKYRGSLFQTLDDCLAFIEMKLNENESNEKIRKEMLKIMKGRRSKFPLKLPNCGSVFVSNPQMYETYGSPGEIIEKLGFKGFRVGGAEVSEHHANFIVNLGSASSSDILEIIKKIRSSVYEHTGYLMEVETRFVPECGSIRKIK